VLVAGGGLLGMVAVTVIVSLLMQGPMVWVIHRIEPDLRIGWRGASRGQARSLLSFSLPIFAIYIAGRLQTETDNLVIGRMLSVARITPYALAQRLSQVGLRVTYQFLKVVLPLAAELDAQGDRRRLRVLYITSTRVTAAIFIPIGCTLIFLSQNILTVWVGQSYAPFAQLVVILTVASFLDTILWPAGSTLRAVERHHPLGVVALCSGMANLALSIILVPHLGLTGVALGTLIPTAVESLGFVLPYTAVTLGIGARQVLGEIFLPALLPAVPMALVLFSASRIIPLSSLLTLVPVIGIAFLLYALAYLFGGAGQYERDLVRQCTEAILRRIRTHPRAT
jgi:O-antigen/teichoic acid export membrane protein